MSRLALMLCLSAALHGQSLAVRADSLHTAAGPVIADGIVVIQDGKITAVGKASDVKVPAGMLVKRAKVAIPGIVDGRSTVGLSGLLNQPHDQDQLEGSAPIQPELRAIDAYNGRDPLVGYLRSLGVTTVHTGHGPGALISGQTFVIKTDATEVTRGVLKTQAMVAATLGDGARARESGKAPGTRGKQIAMLRSELVGAQEYGRKLKDAEKGKEPGRDLRKETLVQVLRKELPLLATAHRAQDILSLLRLADRSLIPLFICFGRLPGRVRCAGLHTFAFRRKRDFGRLRGGVAAARVGHCSCWRCVWCSEPYICFWHGSLQEF